MSDGKMGHGKMSDGKISPEKTKRADANPPMAPALCGAALAGRDTRVTNQTAVLRPGEQ